MTVTAAALGSPGIGPHRQFTSVLDLAGRDWRRERARMNHGAGRKPRKWDKVRSVIVAMVEAATGLRADA